MRFVGSVPVALPPTDGFEIQEDSAFVVYKCSFHHRIDPDLAVITRAGTNTPSDEYDMYRDTGWRIRYVSRIHFFSEAKLGNG